MVAAIDWNLGEWTTVISTVAAAIAALAAWATVYTERRWRRRAAEPLLTISVSQVIDPLGGPASIRVAVENTGGGVAREAYVWVREGDTIATSGLPPTGSIGPGRRVIMKTGLSPVGRDAEAVVVCYFDKYVLAWDAAAREYRASRKRWKTKRESRAHTLDHFYPGAGALKEQMYQLLMESES